MDNLGFLCCVIGIISSIGSILVNLAVFNYKGKASIKIGEKEFKLELEKIEKEHNDKLVKLYEKIEELEKLLSNKNDSKSL